MHLLAGHRQGKERVSASTPYPIRVAVSWITDSIVRCCSFLSAIVTTLYPNCSVFCIVSFGLERALITGVEASCRSIEVSMHPSTAPYPRTTPDVLLGPEPAPELDRAVPAGHHVLTVLAARGRVGRSSAEEASHRVYRLSPVSSDLHS